MQLREGSILFRQILVDPRYAGDVGKLPKGVVPDEYRRYVPGGVYRTREQLEKRP